jgi:hypothetical protein
MIFEYMWTWVIETTEAARKDNPDNLKLCSSLAELYRSQGQYTKAVPLYVACLEQQRIAFGETHLDTLNSMNNLAIVYDNQTGPACGSRATICDMPGTATNRIGRDPSRYSKLDEWSGRSL